MNLQEYIENSLSIYFISKLLNNHDLILGIKDFPKDKLGKFLLFRYYISDLPGVLVPVTSENKYILEFTLVNCFNNYLATILNASNKKQS